MKCNKCKGSGDMGFTYSMRCNKCSGTGSIGVLVIKAMQMNAYNNVRVDITIKDEDPPSLGSGDRVMFLMEDGINDEVSTYFIEACGTVNMVWLLNCRGKYGEKYEVKDPVWIYLGIPGLALEVVVVANKSSG